MSTLIVKVVKISKIEKHPNADKLSIVSMENNSWNCIVALNQYKVGDLVIYCPPDSVIPNNIIEQYNLEYLRKGNRVRTIKLRGYISQGLILDLPKDKKYYEGQNVADILNITKYEPPEPEYQKFQGKQPTKKKRNPLFDKYTDIENIKNYNRIFKEGDNVVISEKIHGTSFRAANLPIHIGYSLFDKIKYFISKFIKNQRYSFIYGSHNIQLVGLKKNFYGEDVYGQIAKKYDLANLIPEDYIIYGEIYGKGIQDLEYGKKDIDIVFFDVKYKREYLSYSEFYRFCFEYKLPMVPVLYIGKFNEMKLKECTEGMSVLYPKQVKEGCVIKSYREENNPVIGRKILKCINEEYLLREGATEYK